MSDLLHIGMSDAEIMRELGRRLRALRGDREQQAVAEASGLTRQTVSRAERGLNPTLLTVVRLLRVYGRIGTLDSFIPASAVSPMALLEQRRGRGRRGSRG
jgi:transcriptional regulator with XRE-family HTH domain